MRNLTNRNLDFLSDENLVHILRTILDEIENTAISGAHRSTTYLAVSAIEGLMLELLRLLKVDPQNNPKWPKENKVTPIDRKKLRLENMIDVLIVEKALPADFEKLYHPIRNFRNYVHPGKELKELSPISQSTGQLALACLNAIIERYERQRFVADQIWKLEYGLARVPNDKTVHMPQNPGEFISLLVTEKSAREFREIKCRIIVPNKSIFNFIYNYFSLNEFMAARIEGRVRDDGRGGDNGRLVCTSWQSWSINAHYTLNTEPVPSRQEHTVQIILQPTANYAVIVDGIQLTLENGIGWDFNPQGKIGFTTELGAVSILDLELYA